MTNLTSKFDIVSVESPIAVAAVALVLDVDSPPAIAASGTPTPGTIAPGMIVSMKSSNGKAELATAPVLRSALALLDVVPKLMAVTIDGNTGFSGAFVQKLTCLTGGFTMVTDQFVAGSYNPGDPVTVVSGLIVVRGGANAYRQIYGFVGPAGYNAATNTLQVVVPQGVCAT